jgi:hypothetical protein
MAQPIEDYLAGLEAELRLSPRRRRRVLAEARAHLEEAAERSGERGETAERAALERFGPVAVVASAFRPRPADRAALAAAALARGSRRADALVAVLVLVCLLNGLVQTAPMVLAVARTQASSALWLAAFVAPTALLTVASPALLLAGRRLGARLAPALMLSVGVTAIVAIRDAPPAAGFFHAFARGAAREGYAPAGAAPGRALAAATDVATQTRLNAALLALAVTLAYLWIVRGRTSRATGAALRLALLAGIAVTLAQAVGIVAGWLSAYPPDLAGRTPALLVAFAAAAGAALASRSSADAPLEA